VQAGKEAKDISGVLPVPDLAETTMHIASMGDRTGALCPTEKILRK
jgi:hypothetical protein